MLPLWGLVIAGVVVFVSLAVVGDYALAHIDNISQLMAPIMILMTYFQTLSMLVQIELRWPAKIRELLYTLSIFNFNLELAAPVRI